MRTLPARSPPILSASPSASPGASATCRKPAVRAASAVREPTAWQGMLARRRINMAGAWRIAFALVTATATASAGTASSGTASGLVRDKGNITGSKPNVRNFAAVRQAPGSGLVTRTRTSEPILKERLAGLGTDFRARLDAKSGGIGRSARGRNLVRRSSIRGDDQPPEAQLPFRNDRVARNRRTAGSGEGGQEGACASQCLPALPVMGAGHDPQCLAVADPAFYTDGSLTGCWREILHRHYVRGQMRKAQALQPGQSEDRAVGDAFIQLAPSRLHIPA